MEEPAEDEAKRSQPFWRSGEEDPNWSHSGKIYGLRPSLAELTGDRGTDGSNPALSSGESAKCSQTLGNRQTVVRL